MKDLLENIFRQLSKKVEQLDGQTLGLSHIEDTLFQEFKIQPPALLTDKTEVSITTEKSAFRNRSKGLSLGQNLYIALYVAPIDGPYELFKEILQGHPWNSHLYSDVGKLYFKEISTEEIIGKTEAIEEIKQKAKARFEAIKNVLFNYKTMADDANNSLKETISKKINDERRMRKDKKASEKLLNPFI